MVPDSYHDLFVASAGVAGALIGLLFVAITVRPEDASKGSVRQRLRPAAALTAFLNALFVSLLALFPDSDVSDGFTAVALISVAAVLGMLIFLVLELRRDGLRSLVRGLLSMAAQLAVSVVQVVAAYRLAGRPEATELVMTIAITVLVMFSIGIDRAWEFVGAQETGLVATLAHAVAAHREHESSAGAPDASEPRSPTDRQPSA